MFKKIRTVFTLFSITIIGLLIASPSTNAAIKDLANNKIRTTGEIFQEFSLWQETLEDSQSLDDSVVSLAAPSVVTIEAYKPISVYEFKRIFKGKRLSLKTNNVINQKISSGSGFFITSTGYIITNKHVVNDTNVNLLVDIGNSKVNANVIYLDPATDLAIIKIEGDNYPTLSLATINNIKNGDEVIAVGNAYGIFEDYSTVGKITSTKEDVIITTEDDNDLILNNLIEIDAKIYPGDSGGPLLNSNGEVIEINTAASFAEENRKGYAIPSSELPSAIKKSNIKID